MESIGQGGEETQSTGLGTHSGLAGVRNAGENPIPVLRSVVEKKLKKFSCSVKSAEATAGGVASRPLGVL